MYTVTDLLASNLATRAEAPALITAAGQVSYRVFAAEMCSWAASLSEVGIGKGDRIGILLPRGQAALAAFFGVQLLGGVAVFIHDALRSAQVGHILRDSDAGAVVTDERHRRLRLAGWGDKPILTTARHATTDTATDLPDFPSTPAIGRDLAALIYTSGSSGAPKGVMFTHENLVSGARIVADYLGLGSADRILALLPWNFDYGLNQVLSTFFAGGCVVPQNSPYPADICRSLADFSVTGLAGVPAVWSLLASRPSPFFRLEFPALRYVTNSGGPLSPATIRLLRQHHPSVRTFAMYGLTEAFRSSYLPPELLDSRPDSIGRAIPNTELLVIGADGRRCGPGEVGELIHSGPTVTAGYWRQPQATARVFRPHPFPPPGGVPNTVVYSGDYVRMDEEGFLYYAGRGDQLFKSRGFRTNPSEIEAALLASGLASEVVVHPIQANDPEPLIVAGVVPAENLTDGTDPAREMGAYAQSELASHLRPHHYLILRDPPRTSSGKTDRMVIRTLMTAQFAAP